MINYNEFLAAFVSSEKLTTEQVLQQAFKKLDLDGNGFITADEISEILKNENGLQSHDAKNDLAWQNLLKQVDQNNDGKISFDEFRTMIQNAA